MPTHLRTALLLGLTVLLFTGFPREAVSRDRNSLDDVILSESFDTTPNGGLPAGWAQVDLDSGYSHTGPPFYGRRTVWQALSLVGFSTHTGPGTSANAYNANGRQNDDWMILPRFDSLLAPVTLTYWVSSQDSNLESFEVRVSTTDAQPSSFTHLMRSVNRTPHMWTQYSDNLSEFAGSHFHVVIHYNSVYKYVIKVDDVLLTATRPSAAPERSAVPKTFSFAGNYPNPFNSQTEFRFSIPQSGAVALILYDLSGRDVAQVVNGTLTAGDHAFTFDASGLSSGIYFARLSTGNMTATRKMVLLR